MTIGSHCGFAWIGFVVTTTFHIRDMTPADVSIVLHHRRSMFADMGDEVRSGDIAVAAFGSWLLAKVAEGRYRGWFVENADGHVIAGGGVWLMDAVPQFPGDTSYRAHVMNVYTEPGYRRRGLARFVMQTILVWCDAQGIKTITLNASDKGRPLYEALGFLPTNDMRLILP